MNHSLMLQARKDNEGAEKLCRVEEQLSLRRKDFVEVWCDDDFYLR